jgi:hypothetical protein
MQFSQANIHLVEFIASSVTGRRGLKSKGNAN